MLFKIEERLKVIKDVAVDFPVYSKHDMEDSIVYSRLEENGRHVSIWIWQIKENVEIDITCVDFRAPLRDPAYYLGWGEYESSREEFETALEVLDIVRRKI